MGYPCLLAHDQQKKRADGDPDPYHVPMTSCTPKIDLQPFFPFSYRAKMRLNAAHRGDGSGRIIPAIKGKD